MGFQFKIAARLSFAAKRDFPSIQMPIFFSKGQKFKGIDPKQSAA
jgi:hypothetical protein